VNDPAPVTVPPSTTGSVAFDIQNASQTGATYDLSIPTCTGVSGCGFTQAAPRPPTSTIFVAGNGGTGTATVYFDSPASGTGTVVLRASFGGTTLDDGSGTVYVANATVSDPAPRTDPTNAVGLQTTFNVLNTTAVSTLYYFTALCVAPVINCSVTSGQSATIGTGQTWPVTVTFGTGATGGTGSLSLSARLYSTAGPIIDTGTQTVTVQATTGVMAIDVATVNPGDLLARGQCLTIAIASAAASECGDLRVVHPLPTVRTMNTWRTPTLVYSSAHAIGWVTIAANLTLPVGTPVPTTVNAALKINTVQVATGSWPGNQWTSGTTRRVALGFSAQTAGLATGVYDYVLEVTNVTTSGSFTATASGKLVVVNRSASAFGAGWWLAGLEEWNPSTAVWVGGDGSGRQYTLRPGSAPPTRVWGAPSMTYPDSIREVGTEFVRQLPDSVWVFFDASGRHVRTRNRQGHLTTFAYTGGGQLQTITLPPAASPLTYTFTYTAGKLTSVVAPAATGTRTVTVWPNATSARVDSIQDPDGRRVKFGYGTDFRMMTRTDRRGTVTSFQYDPGNRVSQSSIEMVSQPPIVRNLQQASSQGWSGASVALAHATDDTVTTDALGNLSSMIPAGHPPPAGRGRGDHEPEPVLLHPHRRGPAGPAPTRGHGDDGLHLRRRRQYRAPADQPQHQHHRGAGGLLRGGRAAGGDRDPGAGGADPGGVSL
jgi:YD repeat-containing protein